MGLKWKLFATLTILFATSQSHSIIRTSWVELGKKNLENGKFAKKCTVQDIKTIYEFKSNSVNSFSQKKPQTKNTFKNSEMSECFIQPEQYICDFSFCEAKQNTIPLAQN